ncbi:hypothetical protein [Flavobacterium sp. NRK1]|jgi:hypothetical protein|uniref:hypothetical protein n=1 Tax=Flavobacterium sp. NRK1 TaxID=2954929 RepID=UPI00209361FB|nr:hypothetical protein [Flavobacterium sp. NRK1]MCO6147446.1 hypothetical protein [Flavobacterium sp. NRK1]
MNALLLTIGLLMAVFFFLIDKNMLPGALVARKTIISQLEKNKKKEMQLQAEFEDLVNENHAWSYAAFPDSDITYAEYIELLKEKASIEYADSEFEKLKSKKLLKEQLYDYIERIKDQEEAMLALQADLDYQRRNFGMQGIATAS